MHPPSAAPSLLAGGLAAWGVSGETPCGGAGQRAPSPLPAHGALGPDPTDPGAGVLGDRLYLPAAHWGWHGGRGGSGRRPGGPHLRQFLVPAAAGPGHPHHPGHPCGLLHSAGAAVDGAQPGAGGDLRADGIAGGMGKCDPGHPVTSSCIFF